MNSKWTWSSIHSLEGFGLAVERIPEDSSINPIAKIIHFFRFLLKSLSSSKLGQMVWDKKWVVFMMENERENRCLH